MIIFQDAGLGVDKDRSSKNSRYLPPHLRGKPGSGEERPPPEPRRDDFGDRGGRSGSGNIFYFYNFFEFHNDAISGIYLLQ